MNNIEEIINYLKNLYEDKKRILDGLNLQAKDLEELVDVQKEKVSLLETKEKLESSLVREFYRSFKLLTTSRLGSIGIILCFLVMMSLLFLDMSSIIKLFLGVLMMLFTCGYFVKEIFNKEYFEAKKFVNSNDILSLESKHSETLQELKIAREALEISSTKYEERRNEKETYKAHCDIIKSVIDKISNEFLEKEEIKNNIKDEEKKPILKRTLGGYNGEEQKI